MKKAGLTNLDVSTRVRIVETRNPDRSDLIGATGVVIPPIKGLVREPPENIQRAMTVLSTNVLCGIIFDPQYRKDFGESTNLLVGDQIEVVNLQPA